jgi:PAS domain S-box-containing protein
MQIKYKFFITALIVLLLTILNVLFLYALNLIAPLLNINFSIYNNFLILLLISALGVSIISYYLTNHLSFNYAIIHEKDDIERKLKKAFHDIKTSNNEMRREIDDRKKIEKTLIESELQVRTIINKAPTGIALLDKEGWILECNPALQNMLDYNEDELSGVLFVQAIHPQDKALYNKKFNALINGASDIYRVDTRYIHKEFREVWGSLSASVVRDAAGQPQFVIAMVEDITTKWQAEEKIVNYQRQLQSLTSELSLIEERERRRIATNLHDHVGQVLTLIGIKIDELHEKVSLTTCNPIIKEIRELIGQTIKSIRSLMFELSPPILYDLGLEEAIEWLAEHFSQEHGLKIQVNRDKQPKPLKTEGNIILFQAVRELLLNIVKHSKATSAKIYIQRACNDLRIIVEDNGIGFELNLIDHNQHKIKGFGLFSIYERLEYYGGNMMIESNKSQGTKITLLMPIISTNREGWLDILKKCDNSYSNGRLESI